MHVTTKPAESIPDDLLAKISEAGTFNEGFGTTEYVAAAHLDMAWHTNEEQISDVNAFEQKALDDLGLIPEIATRYRSTYFGHIFAGGLFVWLLQLSMDRSSRS